MCCTILLFTKIRATKQCKNFIEIQSVFICILLLNGTAKARWGNVRECWTVFTEPTIKIHYFLWITSLPASRWLNLPRCLVTIKIKHVKNLSLGLLSWTFENEQSVFFPYGVKSFSIWLFLLDSYRNRSQLFEKSALESCI